LLKVTFVSTDALAVLGPSQDLLCP